MGGEEGSSSMKMDVMSLTEKSNNVSAIPQKFILPPSRRATRILDHQGDTASLPILDLGLLHHHSMSSQIVKDIGKACKEVGCFLVINHGVTPQLIEDALSSASDFFNLPMEEKMQLSSADVNTPVRYGTSFNQSKDQVHFWRDFLKHYSHPISEWVNFWPTKPPQYREKMGKYAQALQALSIKLMRAILESLGLNPCHLQEDIEQNSQTMAVNCYPACPQPELVLGIPPHSDYGYLTILSQSCEGLQVMNRDEKWVAVPAIEGALLINVGDQLEIMSNGRYKSVIHRAVVNLDKRRISIASLHSFSIEKKVAPAAELVDELHPIAYEDSSFKDFLDFLSSNDVGKEVRFIDTRKRTV